MILFAIIGIILIAFVLWDSFETIILPRRIHHRMSVARVFYHLTWAFWSKPAKLIRSEALRETYLGFYGPLSLIFLLMLWAISLIFGFALVYWGLGIHMTSPDRSETFLTYLYASGTMFFTLGLGDVVANEIGGRLLFVLESGTGFAFLAGTISYLPVLYQSFSRRETHVTLLDARAGSPPTAVNLLLHYKGDNMAPSLKKLLEDWEVWCGDILESHLSYAVLAFYRSQHDHQSWIAALNTILDVSALISVGLDGVPKNTAYFTYAMARHTAVDLAQLFYTDTKIKKQNRLSHTEFLRMKKLLKQSGIYFTNESDAEETLRNIRNQYEPYMQLLSDYLVMPLPPFMAIHEVAEDWLSSPWDKPVK